jgi:hypothetical protein
MHASQLSMLDLCFEECDCLFCGADPRIELVAGVENRSRLLIHISLQRLSDCKHGSGTSSAGIEQFNLFREIKQKP